MARPGEQTTITESGPARGSDTNTGIWFVAGITEKGEDGKTLTARSPAAYRRLVGGRGGTAAMLSDAVDLFFREGGRVVHVGRVVGPAAAVATHMLVDGAAAPTLRVDAASKGEWGNALNVEVEDGGGGTFVLVISDDNLGELLRSPALATKADAIAWAAGSPYLIKLVDQASVAVPAVAAAASLAGGASDLGSITEDIWAAALNVHKRELGVGQCSMPGRTTLTSHLNTIAHALANNRRAVLDAPDTASDGTLAAAAGADRAGAGQPGNRYGAGFAPWVVIPGVAVGTTRTVPPSGLVAGRIAAVDASNSVDDPAAGDLGRSLYAIGISQDGWDDDTRTALNEAGVNVIREINGEVVIYGWRTLADPINDANWVGFAESRTVMAVQADLDNVGERFVLRKNDGRKHAISSFGGRLTAALLKWWNIDALYGATSSEAFSVDVGDTVNTPETIQDGEFNADVGLQVSPTGEMVNINISKKRITEAVA